MQLATEHLQRDSAVIAAVREAADCSALDKLNKEHGDKQLMVTRVTVTDEQNVKNWAKALKEDHGVQFVDLVYNNAGTVGERQNVLDTTKKNLYVSFRLQCRILRRLS